MSEFAARQKRAQGSHLVSPAKPDRATLRPAHTENLVLARQQPLGNQAAQRFAESCPLRLPSPSLCPYGGVCHTCPAPVQAKLTVNKPGDKYEQEADRVADQVMRMPEPRVQRACPTCDEERTVQTKPLAAPITPLVQRQVKPEEEEEEKEPAQAKLAEGAQVQRQGEELEKEEEGEPVQAKPLAAQITSLIQRQVEPEEEVEEEEEPIQTKRADSALLQRQEVEEPEEEEEPIQAKLAEGGVLQRQEEEPEEEEEELEGKDQDSVQLKEVTARIPAAEDSVLSQIKDLRGGGQPLPQSMRNFFEPRFGHNFSQVRIHVDRSSARLARSVNARAFATGQDIVFGKGEYSPETTRSRKLVAHELTHVLQQSSKVRAPTAVQRLSSGPAVRPAALRVSRADILKAARKRISMKKTFKGRSYWNYTSRPPVPGWWYSPNNSRSKRYKLSASWAAHQIPQCLKRQGIDPPGNEVVVDYGQGILKWYMKGVSKYQSRKRCSISSSWFGRKGSKGWSGMCNLFVYDSLYEAGYRNIGLYQNNHYWEPRSGLKNNLNCGVFRRGVPYREVIPGDVFIDEPYHMGIVDKRVNEHKFQSLDTNNLGGPHNYPARGKHKGGMHFLRPK